MTITNHITEANPKNSYLNLFDDCVAKVLGDDNLSEEGKLFERAQDDSVTYASAKGLEPPLPSPQTSKETSKVTDNNRKFMSKQKYNEKIRECNQLSPSPEYLISPLKPVKIALHSNEAHNAIPRCLRSVDLEIVHETLTPRSDTNSFGTACNISPPEKHHLNHQVVFIRLKNEKLKL
ncbi:Protein tincar [Eumeta japonica]|uniref:Protein tincar n=1 Tax=Eumeta variegata TaxID=151549 RepID=A0A4C1SMW1_EUMVA|nr:Protein tincar [Eumeta japonica]